MSATTTTTDDVVSSIVDDLSTGAALPWHDAVLKFGRAVHTLRTAASNTGSIITSEQRQALDTAIRCAQPVIAGEPASADLRIMVCALHVVVGEWANPSRSVVTATTPNVLEAFILARMLDNNLDSALLRCVLERKRAEMAPEQWRWLGDMVQELYPLPMPAAEAVPFIERVVH